MYSHDAREVLPEQLRAFHPDWRYRPEPARLRQMLVGSETVELAWVEGELVGYAAAIGDGAVFAYLSSVEVRPEWRGHGIGTELVRRIRERYRDRYGLDLLCDAHMVPFYERLGFQPVPGMAARNFSAPTQADGA